MAKDTRNIVRGVRIEDTVYTSGQEDELASKLSASRIKELVEDGTLEGDWGKAPQAEETKPAPKPAAK